MTLQSTVDVAEDTCQKTRPGDLLPISSDRDLNHHITKALLELATAQSPKEASNTLRAVRQILGDKVQPYEPLFTAIIERVNEVHNLKCLAGLDELTAIANRRSFNAALQRSIARCDRSGQSLALIMIDLDNLKLINDRFGHRAGDQALCKVAQACLEAVRASDLVARIGGDEFAILLPDNDYESAQTVAKRVQQCVEKQRVYGKQLSISVGLSVTAGYMFNKEKLVEYADAALYQDKNSKRALNNSEAA